MYVKELLALSKAIQKAGGSEETLAAHCCGCCVTIDGVTMPLHPTRRPHSAALLC